MLNKNWDIQHLCTKGNFYFKYLSLFLELSAEPDFLSLYYIMYLSAYNLVYCCDIFLVNSMGTIIREFVI